jgi:DNA-binding response OmpR family regulator
MMMKVLIVEDDLSIADLLHEALEADGYVVSGIARSVSEAKELAEQQEPDFAVIDIRLAHGDLGTEVAANLRRTTSAGIIFSTGNSNGLSSLEELGDAVMTKPYRLRDVGRGLKIIDEMARLGHTQIIFPRNFRLLVPRRPDALACSGAFVIS